MEDGFYIFTVRGGYSPYILVGWVRRRDFFIEVQNCRILKRLGREGQISQLAVNGPLNNADPTQLLDLSKKELVPIFSVGRMVPADPNKWPMCPKPEDWK